MIPCFMSCLGRAFCSLCGRCEAHCGCRHLRPVERLAVYRPVRLLNVYHPSDLSGLENLPENHQNGLT